MKLRLLSLLAKIQLPVAMALVALIAVDLQYGLGLGDPIHVILAALAGALGVKRPKEVAEKIAGALDHAQKEKDKE